MWLRGNSPHPARAPFCRRCVSPAVPGHPGLAVASPGIDGGPPCLVLEREGEAWRERDARSHVGHGAGDCSARGRAGGVAAGVGAWPRFEFAGGLRAQRVRASGGGRHPSAGRPSRASAAYRKHKLARRLSSEGSSVAPGGRGRPAVRSGSRDGNPRLVSSVCFVRSVARPAVSFRRNAPGSLAARSPATDCLRVPSRSFGLVVGLCFGSYSLTSSSSRWIHGHRTGRSPNPRSASLTILVCDDLLPPPPPLPPVRWKV